MSLFSSPTSVKWAHYTDGILQILLKQLQRKRQAVNPQKSQGSGTTVKYWRVVWLGKTSVVPEVVIENM